MYRDEPLQKYLEEAAGAFPAPGGGSVSALTGALGAAMASMVGNFTIGKNAYKEVAGEVKKILTQSEKLRRKLTELVDADIVAYGKVSAAYKLPKESEEEIKKRSLAIESACKAALSVPLKTAECAAEILKLCQRLVDIGNKNLISDVGVAVILARAALEGAVLNVEINLASIKDEAFVREHREKISILSQESNLIRDEVLGKVKEKINRA